MLSVLLQFKGHGPIRLILADLIGRGDSAAKLQSPRNKGNEIRLRRVGFGEESKRS